MEGHFLHLSPENFFLLLLLLKIICRDKVKFFELLRRHLSLAEGGKEGGNNIKISYSSFSAASSLSGLVSCEIMWSDLLVVTDVLGCWKTRPLFCDRLFLQLWGLKKIGVFFCLTTTLMFFVDTLVCYKNAKRHEIGTRGREINQKDQNVLLWNLNNNSEKTEV